MNSIWFRAFCLISLGALLGIFANWQGPQRIPWIRGEQSTAEASGSGKGDLSSLAVKFFSESELIKNGMLVILDARRKEDFLKGHIPNAISLDVREFEKAFESVKDRLIPGFPVIIYCNGGHCEDSHDLAEKLSHFGLSALIYTGGWEAWSSAGYPVKVGE